MQGGFIPPNSGYRKLKSYQKSVIIYDATVYFCRRFFAHDPRQTDQMEKAARSGKQNIAEGSMASATSKQTEIHLTNVARSSLGELKEDYEDFLRTRRLPIWEKNHPTAQEITRLSRISEEVYETYRHLIEHDSSEISANTIRHLAIQCILMLNKQIQRQEQEFMAGGGIRERMTRARLEAIGQSSSVSSMSSESSVSSLPSSSTVPACPSCGAAMKRRTARSGKNSGNAFWGCSKFPDCRGTRPVDAEEANRV